MTEKYLVFDIETTGLRAIESKITCICAKDSEDNWFMKSGSDEKEIINEFLEFVGENKYSLIVSANGKDFDIPFLLIRSYVNDIPLTNLLWLLINHFDVINDITFRRISLDDLAKILGFEVKTGNGLKAIQLYNEGKYTELVSYCSNDVLLTEKVFLKIKEIHKNA